MAEEDELEQPSGKQEAFGDEDSTDDAERAVSSSMVSAWGYNRAAEEIEVSFTNGHTGSYSCTPEQWEEAKETSSPGRFMHQTFL